jgi:hypothetical protein
LTGFDNIDHCKEGTALLWSFGNHQVKPGRYGVNNPVAYQEFFENVCSVIKYSRLSGASDKCSVWWVSTHARIRTIFDDESPEYVTNFNEGMKDFFEKKKCGETNYIDVYNMTTSLKNTVLNKGEDWDEGGKLSYDLVHWGMEVNLIKAQIIINSLVLNTQHTPAKRISISGR